MTPDPSVEAATGWHLAPKHLLFAALGLMTLFVIYNNERFIVDHSDPQWTYYSAVRCLLFAHALAGAVALCLGATQFSSRLRRGHVRLHRNLGRSYVTAVAFYCIRRRNFEQHRQWMIRSYAITLIFLTDRVLDAIPKVTDLDTDASPNIVWMCNIIAWVVPTFIIALPNLRRSAPRATVTSAARLSLGAD